jgi:glycosyltransferase involved in cell wall biosynthesis
MRLAVICDFIEENWLSMDLVADMLCDELSARSDVEVLKVRPRRFPPSETRRVGLSRRDRFSRSFGRFVQYPAVVASGRRRADYFHVADHSYAHLTLFLPKGRVGVFCHDCDALRASREPDQKPHLVVLSKLILAGLRRAAVIFYSTEAVRRELADYVEHSSERLVAAPYGIAPEFNPRVNAFDAAVAGDGPYALHVGTCVPRKNPEFLVELFGALASRYPALRFVQVGGEWQAEHVARLRELGLQDRVVQRRGLSRAELAALYRNAAVVLLPSRAEGFGLPLTEALASGGVVVASDIPVLREVGAEAAMYCPVSDLSGWLAAVSRVLDAGHGVPDAAVRLARADRYTWARQAETILRAYRALP